METPLWFNAGIYQSPEDAETANGALLADAALYRIEREGIQVYIGIEPGNPHNAHPRQGNAGPGLYPGGYGGCRLLQTYEAPRMVAGR